MGSRTEKSVEFQVPTPDCLPASHVAVAEAFRLNLWQRACCSAACDPWNGAGRVLHRPTGLHSKDACADIAGGVQCVFGSRQ